MGKWTYFEARDGIRVSDENNKFIALMSPDDLKKVSLVSSAPDMLDTLEKILDLEDPYSSTYSATEKNMAELARRMILKIRGEP